MTVGRFVLLSANLVAWGGLAWLGRNESGGHFQYYEFIPAVMTIVAFLPPIIFWSVKWGRLGSAWSSVSLLALLPYLFFYTGGM